MIISGRRILFWMIDGKEKRFKKKINIAILCVAIFFFACIIFLAKRYFLSSIFLGDNSVREFFKNQNNDFIDIYKADQNNFFVCLGNKIKLIDIANNKEIWSDDLNFISGSNELILQCKKKIFAVSDIKSNRIVVYNLAGKLYEIKMDIGESLLAFFINKSGDLVYISNKKNIYNICVYNKLGEKVFTNIYSEENIFPVSADVSPDGKILAIVYADLNDIEVVSKVVFINLGDNEHVFASLQEKNNFIYGVSFVASKKIILLSTQQVICENIDQNRISEKWRINFNKSASDIEFNKRFLIAKFDSEDKKNNIKNGNMIYVYSVDSGNKINTFSLGSDVNFMSLDRKLDYVLLTGHNGFFIIDLTSNRFLHNRANGIGDYKKAYFLNKKGEIVFLSNDKISIMTHDIFQRR